MEAFLYLISGKNYHYQQKTRGASVLPPGTVKVSAMWQISTNTKSILSHLVILVINRNFVTAMKIVCVGIMHWLYRSLLLTWKESFSPGKRCDFILMIGLQNHGNMLTSTAEFSPMDCSTGNLWQPDSCQNSFQAHCELIIIVRFLSNLLQADSNQTIYNSLRSAVCR